MTPAHFEPPLFRPDTLHDAYRLAEIVRYVGETGPEIRIAQTGDEIEIPHG